VTSCTQEIFSNTQGNCYFRTGTTFRMQGGIWGSERQGHDKLSCVNLSQTFVHTDK